MELYCMPNDLKDEEKIYLKKIVKIKIDIVIIKFNIHYVYSYFRFLDEDMQNDKVFCMEFMKFFCNTHSKIIKLL